VISPFCLRCLKFVEDSNLHFVKTGHETFEDRERPKEPQPEQEQVTGSDYDPPNPSD
jgi:hypothetical protein